MWDGFSATVTARTTRHQFHPTRRPPPTPRTSIARCTASRTGGGHALADRERARRRPGRHVPTSRRGRQAGDPGHGGHLEQIQDYVWHCHILDHEDHDLMLRFRTPAPNPAP
ncbi:multicopper oxidase domain-containing protein [Aeromicrobium sp.]|uniref:multicopper oxidase domain-containing protein n=1 Tax=Aeromicrobium sp. TaxID=1871063 RepID=UPI00341B52BC